MRSRRFVAPLPLAAIDLAWIYQMEGFYADLDRFLQLVAACEASCRTLINDPHADEEAYRRAG